MSLPNEVIEENKTKIKKDWQPIILMITGTHGSAIKIDNYDGNLRA